MKFTQQHRPVRLGRFIATVLFGVVSLAAGLTTTAAWADSVKVGFVMFLSGAAAGPFGVPARNSAELMVESINKGKVPAPYASKGLAGASIVPVYVDEASK